jgi:hypothetical protein
MISRTSFLLLLLANLVFFTWTQGYLGAVETGREPQRLAQQLNPDKLSVFHGATPSPSPRPEPADTACQAVSGLSVESAEALKGTLAAMGWQTKLAPQIETTSYVVLIPELANKAAAEKKVGELNRFGIRDFKTLAFEGGRHEIVLGSFQGEREAHDFLAGMSNRGVKSARLESRFQALSKVLVEVSAPADSLKQQLPGLIAAYSGARLGDCAKAAQ